MNDETATALDEMRKGLEHIIRRLAKDRRKSRESNANALIYWGDTRSLFMRTLEQIEKSHEVLATSKALLQKIERMRSAKTDSF